MKSIKKNLFLLLISLFLSFTKVNAFDASPFNTQSAELSQGGWWTLYSETYFNSRNRLVTPVFAELRYTFFDKLRLGALGALSYVSDGNNSAFGFSNLILTTELEVYDFEKHDFIKLGAIEPIDHANIFFNQFIPVAHNDLLGSDKYAYNIGIEWQKQFNDYVALYSELGYQYSPEVFDASDHNFIYNNSLSFQVNKWFEPYIELLALTNFESGETTLLLAPGLSIYNQEDIYVYMNPIFSINGGNDWGFQFGVSGNI